MECDNANPDERSVWDARAKASSKHSSHDRLNVQPLTRQLADRSTGCAQPSQWTLIPEPAGGWAVFSCDGTGNRAAYIADYVSFT